jgi:predicted Co/Zn/Cd cation transporter (cation efflux family)
MRLTITVAILTLLLASVTSQAAEPVLQFTPTTPTTVNLSASEQITIEYRVTNQSRRTFRVGLTPMPGIT